MTRYFIDPSQPQKRSQLDSMLVCSMKMQVESFYRQADGIWAIGSTLNKSDQSVRFRSLEIDLPLAGIYANVALAVKPRNVSSGSQA